MRERRREKDKDIEKKRETERPIHHVIVIRLPHVHILMEERKREDVEHAHTQRRIKHWFNLFCSW